MKACVGYNLRLDQWQVIDIDAELMYPIPTVENYLRLLTTEGKKIYQTLKIVEVTSMVYSDTKKICIKHDEILPDMPKLRERIETNRKYLASISNINAI